MHVRVSSYQLDASGDVDSAVKAFEDSTDVVSQMEGSQGLMLLLDRDGGKAMTITFWDTEDNLRASAEKANQVREQASAAGGLTITGVESYEVAMEIGR